MSHILWKYYLEDDVDKFEAILSGGNNTQHAPRTHGGATHIGTLGAMMSSSMEHSPRTILKSRKSSGQGPPRGLNSQLSRIDLNSRDRQGCTLLHRAASATSESGMRFAMALVAHPLTDIHTQDLENGWTPLHRACYFGNIALARLLVARDQSSENPVFRGNSLIKIKDHEGNSAFDVYNATIARRTLEHRTRDSQEQNQEDEEDDEDVDNNESKPLSKPLQIGGDEVFAFGSNKNLTLGFGDEDDRQYPERVSLKRPDHLIRRFYREHLAFKAASGQTLFADTAPSRENDPVSDLPALIRNKPIIIEDVLLSKLHSAILTTDPESNLHMCGFGPGGRLGTGDESTRFSYVCIEGGALVGKKVVSVALGLNHTLAISSEGEIYSWGTNTYGQLGYSLPRPAIQDEEPVNNSPRQLFGPLKREFIAGVAASGVHSIAYTPSSLFTWGKNNGQLGLMDSDSRSLEMQTVPRRVAASLFSSVISMVSAIDRATIVLLANHSVCVFTNYGYNYVKFPLYDGFTNNQLNALTTRYEADAHISAITSNGDTIAALSSRGDLFTVTVTQNPGSSAASTTNPSKIRSALSQPQRIWSLRKGNWDGVKSVGVGENGSVIICTKAGAVYRRVNRVKVKGAFSSGGGESRKKDFKFQRVAGLTNVVAVRSSAFGTYAAIRKDCDVTRTQVLVDNQTLWGDLAPLLSIKGFQPSEASADEGHRFWTPGLSKEHFDQFKRGVLTSPNLERDIAKHVATLDQQDYDLELSSSLSETLLPVHGFILAARSPILRHALLVFRELGNYELPEVFSISSQGGRIRIQFQALDFITILNLALYAYEDEVVDVWHFTRHVPAFAFRFRQIRTELMKLAGKLGMTQLETAVRLMVKPDQRLNIDFALAVRQHTFFEDGDTIIELDGDEMRVHSALLRQRCPFFDGLFGGRAGGQWLAGRRDSNANAIRIDMKHIEPSVFELVLRHFYADIGTELFDEIVSEDLDELCDLIMDVLAVANELMLDRLSQICQHTLARFVNTRNICHLLNAVAPVAVAEFKDAGLEYLCLQLESMLENHLLDDLDEDLLLELDEVVRENQLACQPFVRSGRADSLLYEKHPELVEELDLERQRRVRDLAFKAQTREDDQRLSQSFKNRVGSLDDMLSSSPQDKGRRRSQAKSRNTPFSPVLRPKDSSADLMFDMDEDDGAIFDPTSLTQPLPGRLAVNDAAPAVDSESTSLGKQVGPSSPRDDVIPSTPEAPHSLATGFMDQKGAVSISPTPWSSKTLPSAKLGMKDIMAQASTVRTSNLSMSLSAQKAQDEAVSKHSTPKMSQKERKKQQQQALQRAISQPQFVPDKSLEKPASPWQVASAGAKTSLKDVLSADAKPSPTTAVNLPSQSIPPLSLGKRPSVPQADTRFAGQQRKTSTHISKQSTQPSTPPPSAGPSRILTPQHAARSSPLMPHSKSYTKPSSKAEPSLQLTMADIIGQQEREQDLIKEAVAKRSLQEIQEEQAFQEWWELESRRAQEEEAARVKALEKSSSSGGGNSGGRGKNPKRGKGPGTAKGRNGLDGAATRGRGKGRGQHPNESVQT